MDKALFGMEEENVNVSSEDDDDSSDDDNNALEQRAEEIERELSNNVYLYDLHVELVNICEQTGDLTSMRLAYERFAKTFPLTATIWLQWIKVEMSLATTDDDKKTVLELFGRATKDYLSVQIWLEYVQFAMSNCELKETHEILEHALSVAGLHYSDASLLWDILRELEMAHLSITEKDTDAYQAQLNRVIDSFKRQLSVPLINIDSTYAEWQEFICQLPEDAVDSAVVEKGYNNALKSIEAYKPYEERMLMASTDEELYSVYKEYIKHIKDPSLIICLYERALEKLCLIPQVWIDYIHYCLKLGDVSLKISERALRNVTWCEQLWCMRLKILEKHDMPPDDVMQCFEHGLASIPDGLELWLDYVAYTKRNNPDRLLKLFDQAEDTQINDPTFKLTRFHADVCAKSGNMDRARELWNALMHDPTAKSTAQFWLEYVRLERQFGSISQARGILNRAMLCNTDWPQSIADQWLMFEREEGTLEDMFKCTEKINKILPEKLQKAQEVAVTKTTVTTTTVNKGKMENGKRKHDKVEHKSKDDNVNAKKQKTEFTGKKPLAKNQGKPPDLDTEKSVFISNISPTVTQQQLSALFPNGKVTLATNNNRQSRCFGFVQFKSPEDAETALARDREQFESRPIFISKCKSDPQERQASFKFSNQTENNKLFVRGLPVKYSQEDVEKLFQPYGCTDVRLVLHKSGQSKGLAYVEFANEEDAEKALKATDNITVEHFVISVVVSAPPPKTANKERQEPHRHARSRIQVPLIPRAAMKQQELGESNASGNNSSNVSVKPKSNNDFRTMLLQNK